MDIKLETTTKTIKKYISCGDRVVINYLYQKFEETGTVDMNGVSIAKELGMSRASVTNTAKLLQVLGIISTQSMGVKGTRMTVRNMEALKILREE